MDEPGAAAIENILRLAVDAVATGQHDTGVGIDLPDPVEGLAAVQPRHDHVQEHQVDVCAFLFEPLERLDSTAGDHDRVSERLEHFFGDFEDDLLIVHQKDRLTTPAQLWRGGPRLDALHIRGRQADADGRAAAERAVDGDQPAVVLCDAIRGGQAETGPFSPLLGGEEGIEDAQPGVLVHAVPGIGDGDLDVGTRLHIVRRHIGLVQFDVVGLDVEIAAAGHRLPCVDENVKESVLDLTAIHFHAPEIVAQLGDDPDLLLGPPEHLGHFVENLVHIRRRNLVLSATSKAEQLFGEIGGARDRCLDSVQIAAMGVVLVEAVEHQRGVSPDSHQQVIEVVGEPSGEGPDRLHLLRLQQLPLEPPLLRDVSDKLDNPGDLAAPAVLDRKPEELDPLDGRPLWTRDDLNLRFSGLDGTPRGARIAGLLATLVAMEARLALERGLFGVPLLHVSIDVYDPQVRVEHTDAVLDAVDDIFEEGLAVGQSLLRVNTLGDVLQYPLIVGDGAAFVTANQRPVGNPDRAEVLGHDPIGLMGELVAPFLVAVPRHLLRDPVGVFSVNHVAIGNPAGHEIVCGVSENALHVVGHELHRPVRVVSPKECHDRTRGDDAVGFLDQLHRPLALGDILDHRLLGNGPVRVPDRRIHDVVPAIVFGAFDLPGDLFTPFDSLVDAPGAHSIELVQSFVAELTGRVPPGALDELPVHELDPVVR